MTSVSEHFDSGRPDPESNWDIREEIGFRDRRSAIVPSGLSKFELKDILRVMFILSPTPFGFFTSLNTYQNKKKS